MSNTIRGINIEISGETTGLQRALSDVNNQSRSLQSELRQVERLLQLDPTNTELVAQKQKLLSDAIANSGEKLNRLSLAQEQVNEQFQKGDITEKQYRAFQREVAKTELELRNLENRLNDTGASAETFGNQLAQASETLTAAGTAVTAAGVAMAAGLGAAVKIAADFEQELANAKAISGATTEELGLLKQAALEMGATTSFSATQAAAAMTELLKGGMSVEQLLSGGLKAALDLASAGGLSMGEAAGYIVKTMGPFNIAAKDAGIITNILAGAANASATDVSEMGFAMSQVATIAAQMGADLDDTATALALFANKGLVGSDAGTSLKTMLMRLVPSTKEATDAFKKFGLMTEDGSNKFFDSEGRLKSLSEVSGILKSSLGGLSAEQQQMTLNVIFGSDAIRAAAILTMEGAEGFDTMAESMGKVTAAEVSAEKLDTLNGSLSLLKSSLETAAISIGDSLIPAIRTIGESLKVVVDAFNSLPQPIKSGIAITGALVAALMLIIGPIMLLAGLLPTVATGFTVLAGLLATVVAKLALLAVAFTLITSPIGLVIAAIVGLIAAGIAVYKNWDDISAGLKKLWEGIKDTASKVWDGIKDFFKKWGDEILLLAIGPAGWVVLLAQRLGISWESIKQTALNVWNNIRAGISNVWSNITSSVSGSMSNLYSAVRNGMESAWSYIRSIPSQAYSWGRDIVRGLIDGITGFVDRAVAAASNLADKISATVKRILGIASPSTVMDEFGRMVALGLAQGIANKQDEAKKAVERLASVIQNTVRAMLTDLDRSLQLSNATFGLRADAIGADKARIDLERLQVQAENTRQRIELLTIAHEKSNTALGTSSEVTKDLAHQLSMAQIELREVEQETSKISATMREEAVTATKALKESISDLSKEITVTEEKLRKDLATALEEYERKVVDVNNKLIQDEQRITAEYESHLNRRADALANFVNIFDAVTPKEVSGDKLLANLRGQVAAFEDWQASIAVLVARGVDEGLIDELREMGPKAGPEIAALNTLTDEQLSEYVALWRDKNQAAREEAINQLQQQRIEMQQELMDIRMVTAEQLEQYRVEWEKKNAEIRKNTEEEMKRIQIRFEEIAKSGAKYGVELVTNFTEGMESQFENLQGTLENMTSIIDSYMPHSPAKQGPLRRLNEWGPALVKGLTDGISKNLPKLGSISASMAGLSATALGSAVTNNSSTINSGNSIIQITVQDGEDLLRTLRKLGVSLP